MFTPVVQDIKRLQTISAVLTKHGFSAIVRRTALSRFNSGSLDDNASTEDSTSVAQRFRQVLEELGPTYVKLGQVMSTRVDLFPPDFISELTLLRDRVATIPFDQIKEQIEQSLGQSLTELFDTFDETPIAAASIGQVHQATTHDGYDVVVKVQRPNIREAIQSDIDILYLIASMLEATVQEVEIYSPKNIIRAFEAAILSELDFRAEAKNSELFASNFADIEYISTPKIYHELSCSQVLTLQQIKETPLSEIKGGTPRAREILSHILDATVKQVMYDGYFHGDPHPGNIFVSDDNHLIYIDFGLVGRLTREQQDVIVFIIISAMNRDVDGLSRVLLRMGEPKRRIDLRLFKSDISEILDTYLIENLADIDIAEFIQECTRAAQRHGLRLNANYAVLTKVAATIEGIMRQLDPELDIMKVGLPYAQKLTRERFSPDQLLGHLTRSAFRLSSSASEIPQQVEQVLLDLENGNFEVQMKNPAFDELGNKINTLGTRLLLSISASGLAITAGIFLRNSTLTLFGTPIVDVAGVACLVFAAIFFLWSLGWHMFGGGSDMRLRLRPLIRLFGRSSQKIEERKNMEE